MPDWYRYKLDLKMVHAPGEKAVYCSANPHLLDGVIAKKTGRGLPDLFRDLAAEPLRIRHYGMNLTPTGDAYMGYKKGTVQAFFAGGNGGQVVMGIPKLGVVIAFFGGNYSDAVLFLSQRVFVPEYILPAVNGRPRERDLRRLDATVQPLAFTPPCRSSRRRARR